MSRRNGGEEMSERSEDRNGKFEVILKKWGAMDKKKVAVWCGIVAMALMVVMLIFGMVGVAILFGALGLIVFGLLLINQSGVSEQPYVVMVESSLSRTDIYSGDILRAMDEDCLFCMIDDEYVAVMGGMKYFREQEEKYADAQFYILIGGREAPELYVPLSDTVIKENGFRVYEISEVTYKGQIF